MKKILIWAVVGISLYLLYAGYPRYADHFTEQSTSGDHVLKSAFENRQSSIQVEGSGVVVNILSDDADGSRHQRFILRLSSGQTILISHNIDLAPRVNALGKGDSVEFYGQYEWNPQGGVIHWTHHDPAGRHEGGWLKHNDEIFQ